MVKDGTHRIASSYMKVPEEGDYKGDISVENGVIVSASTPELEAMFVGSAVQAIIRSSTYDFLDEDVEEGEED